MVRYFLKQHAEIIIINQHVCSQNVNIIVTNYNYSLAPYS